MTVELVIDVTAAAGLGEPAHVAASVVLPDPADLSDRPVVAFAKPGGGYSRGYYTCALPGPGEGAQAQFHAARGWIFVSLDTLGSGGSSLHDPARLGFAAVTAAALAAEAEVLGRLANGVLHPGYPPVLQPVRLAVGQSTGASIAVVQQARHRCYDGLALLGFSAVHNHPATPPGYPPVATPWFARDLAPEAPGGVLNADALARASHGAAEDAAWSALAWGFHYDDVSADVVEADLAHYEAISRGVPPVAEQSPWNSYTTPADVTRFTLTPGIIAPEAAAVAVPVLSAMGERDLVVDPAGEARAFRSVPSFDLFVCPRMGHMHNFAGTRALLWERLHRFGEWCESWKALAA